MDEELKKLLVQFAWNVGINVASQIIFEQIKTVWKAQKESMGLSYCKKDAFDLAGELRTKQLVENLSTIASDVKLPVSPQLTEMEEASPESGFNLALKQYYTTPLEDKLHLLRNALINGFIGDYTIAKREQFYKICLDIQPTDIVILHYLVKLCPSQEHLKKIMVASEESTQKLYEDRRNSFPTMGQEEYNRQFGQITGTYEELYAKTELKFMAHHFSCFEFEEIKMSLDRLKSNSLIYNATSTVDYYDPHGYLIAKDPAQAFLRFVGDPRNQLKKS